MRKIIVLICTVLLLGMALFAADKKDSRVLTVGATPQPHAELLKLIADDLAAQGITLKVVEFTDYVLPNEALESGQLDANFLQHLPYLQAINRERKYHLVSAGGIHIEPLALYSRKVKSLAELKSGAVIAIPNDPTNEGRALLLLQAAGLLTLDARAGLTATPLDIKTNPRKLKFREIEAASLPRVLADVDAAVINGNYALAAGLSAARDGLTVEGAQSPYVNIVAVKSGNEKRPEIMALVKALQSARVKEYIASRYPDGEVVAVF
ncbi:MAG: MetQ/NlpA family ABC transporter substrate-binding protein [Candidatus Margulisbacteria bacterium]|jgi:D-methionine transport system substrate-binding protein|nr:MetQ/NlpA family ABC transporter substrate-binding protein [Candidatus Margulisiibacteriota bacterium]